MLDSRHPKHENADVAGSTGVKWYLVPWVIVAVLVALIIAMSWYAQESGMFEESGLGAAIVATNGTDRVVSFRLFAEAEWVDLPGQLQPGETDTVLSRGELFEPSTLTVDGCTEGDLVAVSTGGVEVAPSSPAAMRPRSLGRNGRLAPG